MKNEIIANGTAVEVDGIEATIIGYAKGWYKIEDVDGNKFSARRKDIELAGESKKRTMAETLRNYAPGYEGTQAYSGRKSLMNGDEVAEFLEGMAPSEVLKTAEKILGLATGELNERYSHLNPGQIRMNGGNLLRFAIKRGEITAKDLH